MCGICGSTDDPGGRRGAGDERGDGPPRARRRRRPRRRRQRGRSAPGGSASSTSRAATSRSPTRTARSGRCSTARSTTTRALRELLRERGHQLRDRRPTPRCSSTSTRSTATSSSTRSRACSPSRSGTRARPSCWSPATASARSRSSTRERGGELAFASELTALAAGAGVGAELDPAAVDAFFVFGYVPGPSARSCAGVAPAAARAPADLGARAASAPSCSATGSPPAPRSRPPTSRSTSWSASCGRLLEASVRSRLIADVPLGVFLSGGVDSTLIAALAARQSSAPDQDLHGRLRRRRGRRDRARRARRRSELGAEHHELVLRGRRGRRARARPCCAALDQPLADQALPAPRGRRASPARTSPSRSAARAPTSCSAATRATAGWRAPSALGGAPAGGAGRGRGRAAARGRRCPPAARGRLADVLEPRAPRSSATSTGSPAGAGHARRALRAAPARRRPLERGLAAELDGAGVGRRRAPVAGRFMLLDQRHWLPDDVLVKADRASMLVSLEIRTPYLDTASWPSSRRRSRPSCTPAAAARRCCAALLAELLPDRRCARPKTAFRVPAADWLRGPLAPVLRDQVARRLRLRGGLVRPRRRRRRSSTQHLRGDADRSAALWPLLAFGLWLDRLRGRDAG